MGYPRRLRNGTLVFNGYPSFRPNLTPKEMFQMGSFGGTYWRPIYSRVTRKRYSNMHKVYPKSWWKGIEPTTHLTVPWDQYDVSVNTYGVKVGSTLRAWEAKKWITPYHPYGWVQWYCDFYMGVRSPDDDRQIRRWSKFAGPKGRFRREARQRHTHLTI